ncbi:hypothetical protein BV20DRAFT_940489 [Pilatotrama ljubarskyi]|nr:hypothetical protein BV20DRAFT_940489 [Pilatotrama ljubarskyi]
MLKKLVASLGTPKAPKHTTVPLPELDDAGDATPPLVPSWPSSESSSSGTPSPRTPSPRASPIAHRAASKRTGSRAGTPTDVYGISRYSSPDPAMEKLRPRRLSTPAPEIMKPTPRRAFVPPLPSTTVMQVALPPAPVPQKPLKGILKHPRPATTAPSSSSASPPPLDHAARPASSASRRPSNSSPLALHWQLLPPNGPSLDPSGRGPQKRLFFDVTKSTKSIVIRDYSERPPKVSRYDAIQAYLEKEACNVHLRKMTIRYERIPGLEINVTGKGGNPIRCKDVFEAIYEYFDRVMTPEERSMYITLSNLKSCEAAFLRRCQTSERAVPLAEQRKGMRFVDLLEGNTLFLGLRRPPDDGGRLDKYWVIDFGPCSSQ